MYLAPSRNPLPLFGSAATPTCPPWRFCARFNPLDKLFAAAAKTPPQELVILMTSDKDVRRISTDRTWLPTVLRATTLLLIALASISFTSAAPPTPKPLQIYFIDVEGGQATLFVTPEGQSLLIDTGWPDNNFRDADRIVAAAKDAGVTKLDFVLITHYHDDHVGGARQLAQRISIGTFVDHGETRESQSLPIWLAYKALLDSGKYQHIVAKPGDVLPVKGMRVEVITADGNMIQASLPGAGQPNPYCANSPEPPADKTENLRSLGTLITFGKLRILDLGDLTADKERELMCPINRLGKIDIYIASHHGFNQSGSAALVHAIGPRIAIVDNGAKKGGSPSALDIIKSSPGLVDMWQLHFSEEAGAAHNAATKFIANPTSVDHGRYLEVIAGPDETIFVSISGTLGKGYGWFPGAVGPGDRFPAPH